MERAVHSSQDDQPSNDCAISQYSRTSELNNNNKFAHRQQYFTGTAQIHILNEQEEF